MLFKPEKSILGHAYYGYIFILLLLVFKFEWHYRGIFIRASYTNAALPGNLSTQNVNGMY